MRRTLVLSCYLAGFTLGGAIAGRLYAQSWEFRRLELASNCTAVDAVDSSTVFFYGVEKASGRPAVFRTTDGGIRWDVFPWDDWAIYDLSATDSVHVWAVNIWRVYHSSDGGRTWQIQFDASADTSITDFLNYVEMFDPLHGVVVGDAPARAPLPVLLTADGGKTWQQRNQSHFVGAHLRDLWRGVDFLSPMVGYIGYGYFGVPLDTLYMHRTVDGGASWEPLPLAVGDFTLVRFFDETLGLAAWKGDRPVYMTKDGGLTWVAHQPSLGDRWFADLEFLPEDPSIVLAALSPTDWRNPDDILAVSSDTGKTWNVLRTPSIGHPQDLEMVDSVHGYAVGDRGVLCISRVGSGVMNPRTGAVPPAEFFLRPNRPNPFAEVTNITVDLTRPQPVTVEVFDVQGRRVATIVNGELLETGTHTFYFVANKLPSGVYLCVGKAGSTQVTRRMVLLR